MKFSHKIEEPEVVCAKAVNQVSPNWVELIDDAKLEKFTEELRTVEAEVNQLKDGMK